METPPGDFIGAETGSCWLLGNAVCLQSMENSHGEIFFFTTGIVALKPLWQLSMLAKKAGVVGHSSSGEACLSG